jgi:hypothetical protein
MFRSSLAASLIPQIHVRHVIALMLGDGILPADANTGNLIVVSGTLIRDLP